MHPARTLALVVGALASLCGAQEATVSSGRLLGERVAGAGGARDYIAFRGVPYAAPPVGAWRFRAPRPVSPWGGVRDATVEGDMCPQEVGGALLGSEDCLNLNVFTPSLTCPPTPYAVLVFIHGGFLKEGSASVSPYYGPDFLVHHDVVLVLVNYRLGALGFLNMDTTAVPGNAGAKDAVSALEWVKKNIGAFCGDSKRVTIMGQSAGSKLVAFLGLSEMTTGLFRASIQLSGIATGKIAYTELNKEAAVSLAAMLGNQDNSTASVERTLLAASWQDILKQSSIINDDQRLGLTYTPFSISPESRPVDDEPVFIDRDPESIIVDPPRPRVPTLTGVMSRESLVSAYELLKSPSRLSALGDNFREVLKLEVLTLGRAYAERHGVSIVPNEDVMAKIERKVKEQYFGGSNPSTDFPEGLANMIGDMRYVYPLYRWATLLDSQQDGPLYLYLFDLISDFNLEKEAESKAHISGAAHRDDLGYLFHVTSEDLHLHQNISSDGQANRTLRRHTKLITDFVKNLTSPLLEGGNVVGRRQRPPYLYIADFYETRVENTLGAEARMALWDEVMALFLNKNSTNQASSLSRSEICTMITVLAVILTGWL